MTTRFKLLRHGAGQYKTLAELKEAHKHYPEMAVARLGAYTDPGLPGNSGTVEFSGLTAYGNAIGLKNDGIPWLSVEFPKIYAYCKEHGIQIIVNIAGTTVEGNIALAIFFAQFPDVIVEFNGGCPNGEKRSDGLPAVPVCYSMKHVDAHMSAIAAACQNPLAYKPGPILDSGLLAEQAQYFVHMKREGRTVMLCAINTIGTCMPIENTVRQIGVKYCGGSGGELMRWLGFGQVYMWRLALGDEFEIDAHGGIQHGDHVADYVIGAGATYCSVSAEWRRYPRTAMRDILSTIPEELLAKYAV